MINDVKIKDFCSKEDPIDTQWVIKWEKILVNLKVIRD